MKAVGILRRKTLSPLQEASNLIRHTDKESRDHDWVSDINGRVNCGMKV